MNSNTSIHTYPPVPSLQLRQDECGDPHPLGLVPSYAYQLCHLCEQWLVLIEKVPDVVINGIYLVIEALVSFVVVTGMTGRRLERYWTSATCAGGQLCSHAVDEQAVYSCLYSQQI
jgi:hypothetical protein